MTYREAAVIRPRGGGKPRPVRKPINELMKNYEFRVWSWRESVERFRGVALHYRGGTPGMPICKDRVASLTLLIILYFGEFHTVRYGV